MYDVASVDTDTQVTLSVAYAGVTASGAVYAIGTGFTVPDSFPEMSQGDIETATIFTRAMRKIQGKFNSLIDQAALANAQIFMSVAGGITGTSSGEFFFAVSGTSYTLYINDNGEEVEQVKFATFAEVYDLKVLAAASAEAASTSETNASDSADDSANSKSLADDARDITLGYRDETKAYRDDAVAVVTGGTATLEPEAGKIPLADAEGVIDSAWLGQYDPGIKQRREDLLKQATLSLDFANNKYEVYEGPVNSLTQMPFNEVLDFTRASAATARTATGKIQGVLTDEQRLVGNREGLLIEEQRTNLVLWSEDFTQGAWAKDSITISPDAIFAPDASQTADRLAAGPANSRLRQTFTALGGEPIAVSYFIKKSNRALQRSQIYSSDLSQNKVIDVDFDSKTVFAPDASYRKIAELENGWHLVQVVFSAFDGVNTLFIRPSQTTVDEGAEVYVWGAQIEAGSTPSSYIKTEGAQVTRAADNCVRVLGDEFNAGELTLYYQSGTGINGFENSNTGLRLMFNISDDSSSYIGFVPDGRFKAGKSGSLFSAPNNWTDVQSGNPFKFAIAISYLTGGVNVAINGVISSYTDTAIPLVSNVLNVHTISSADPSGGSYANDTIKDFRVFPAALSEAELITLTGG